MDTKQLIDQLVIEGAQKPLPGPMRQTLVWLAGTSLYVTTLTAYNGVRSDIADKLGNPRFALELVLLFAIASSAALAAFCLSRPDAHQKPWLRFVPLGFLVLWAMTAFSGAPELTAADILQSLTAGQFDCPWNILMLSVPPGVVMFLIIRRGATIRCCWAGGMATLGATSLGYLWMRMIEQNDNLAHLIVWHAVPILLMCVVGMMAGHMALRWR
ncbi:MAG: DUF1109 family protein [Thiobacillus sp.]|nr:DUF1109 family protein [Thiobacillus sp.]